MYQILNNLSGSLKINSPSAFITILIISIVIGLYCLSKGGDLLSDHCSNLAKSVGIPSVVVGLTIVSIATSAPELFTSISAINSGADGLVLGNIIGSNIANIGLILAISLIICPMETKNSVSLNQKLLILILTFVFVGYLFFHPAHSLGFLPGCMLLIFIIAYLFYLTSSAIRNKHAEKEINERLPPIYKSSFMVILSTIALWVGSDMLVFGAKNLAMVVGIPEELIGFTLLALGTSLPELAASISLVKKNEIGMLLGNILGSNIFNIGLVGGVAGILGPINVSTNMPWIDYLSLIVLTIMFIAIISLKEMTRRHGLFLLFLYVTATVVTWKYNS